VLLLTPAGERIEVWVHRMSDDGRKVRLCFEAPETIVIKRAELAEPQEVAAPQ